MTQAEHLAAVRQHRLNCTRPQPLWGAARIVKLRMCQQCQTRRWADMLQYSDDRVLCPPCALARHEEGCGT